MVLLHIIYNQKNKKIKTKIPHIPLTLQQFVQKRSAVQHNKQHFISHERYFAYKIHNNFNKWIPNL